MLHRRRSSESFHQGAPAYSDAAASRRVLYIQYTNPAGYPPLEHSSRILADHGWQVTFLGTGAQGAQALRFPPHPRIAVRLMPFQAPGWRQKLHYLQFCALVLLWSIRWRPTLLYVSDALACPAGLLLSYLPGLRVIYHEHDSPEPESREGLAGRPSGFMRGIYWARRRLARRAWRVVLPGAGRVEHFLADTGADPCRACSVWNCPACEEIGPARAEPVGSPLRLLYHGSVVPARLPFAVIEAMAILHGRVSLTVVGYETIGHRGYLRELAELAECLGIDGQIELVGAVPTREQLYAHCRAADVGIALMPTRTSNINEQTMLTGPSNKIFDYLACGLAALVPDQPGPQALYVAPGYARACNPANPASIADALRWYIEHPAELRAMGERGRQRVLSEWNYEQQFAPVLAQLSEA